MATVLERVPVDEVRAEAREIHPGASLLTVLTAVLVGIGWVLGAVWAGVAWALASVKVGFRQGSRLGLQPSPDGGG